MCLCQNKSFVQSWNNQYIRILLDYLNKWLLFPVFFRFCCFFFLLCLDNSVDISSMFPVSSVPSCQAHRLYLKMEDMGAAFSYLIALFLLHGALLTFEHFPTDILVAR